MHVGGPNFQHLVDGRHAVAGLLADGSTPFAGLPRDGVAAAPSGLPTAAPAAVRGIGLPAHSGEGRAGFEPDFPNTTA
ncbi:hypothetical protein GCM10023405_32710 [Streptomonospora salina]